MYLEDLRKKYIKKIPGRSSKITCSELLKMDDERYCISVSCAPSLYFISLLIHGANEFTFVKSK